MSEHKLALAKRVSDKLWSTAPLVMAFAALGGLGHAPKAEAATINVTTTADNILVDGDTTLREAVLQANTLSGDDEIVLGAGTFVLNYGGPLDNSANGGDLDITRSGGNLIIRGAGPANTIIDSQMADRVFHILGSNTSVEFQDLTIYGGTAYDDGYSAYGDARGGGILNDGGQVTLDNVTVSDNVAYGFTGTYFSTPGTNGVAGESAAGGGIFSDGGTLSLLNNSSVTTNFAQGGDGQRGADGDTSYSGQGGAGGTGGDVRGGGIYLRSGELTIQDSSVTNNDMFAGDGGNGGQGDDSDYDSGYRGGAGGRGGEASGGGVYARYGTTSLFLDNATITGNFMLAGQGGYGGDGGDHTGANYYSGGNGGAGGAGGDAQGGGLFCDTSGPITLLNSTISSNIAYGGGGRSGGDGGDSNNVYNEDGGDGGQGGSGGALRGIGAYFGANAGNNNPYLYANTFSNNFGGGGDGAYGGNGGNATNGSSADGGGGGNGGGGGAAMGGGLFFASYGGQLVGLNTVSNNTIIGGAGGTGGNGGTGSDFGFTGGAGGSGGRVAGGGIFANYATTLSIDGATIASNGLFGRYGGRGGNGGRGVPGSGTASFASFRGGPGGSGGDGSNASGGGVYVYLGAPQLTNTTITGNSITAGEGRAGGTGGYGINDGGIGGSGGVGGSAQGGGIAQYGATLTILQSTISNNTIRAYGGGAGGNGGDANNFSGGNGGLGGSGGNARGGGLFNGSGALYLTDTTVATNVVYGGPGGNGGHGGSFSGNGGSGGSAGRLQGGGVFTDAGGAIRNSTLSGNILTNGADGGDGGNGASSSGNGGGYGAGSANEGGGLFVNGGTLLVSNSTISGNDVRRGGFSGYRGANGSGSGSSSFYGGYSSYQANGGGIFINNGTLNLRNSTVASNSADYSGGGVGYSSGAFNAVSSIIADNTANYFNNDVDGFFSSVMNTLVEDPNGAGGITDGVNGNIVGTDPSLYPLADNGGPTQTHAFDENSSVVLDSGSDPDTLGTDQRGTGFDRVSGAAADMGAYEAQTGGGDVAGVLLKKFLIGSNFNNPANDHIRVVGFIDLATAPLPRGTKYAFEGLNVAIDIGGATFNFTLDAKGRAGKIFKATYIRRKNQIKILLNGNDGFYQFNFFDEGLINVNAKGTAHTVNIDFTMDTLTFNGAVPVTYHAQENRTGKAQAKNQTLGD